MLDSVHVRRGRECALLTSSPVMLKMQVPGHTLRITCTHRSHSYGGWEVSPTTCCVQAGELGKLMVWFRRVGGEGERWRGCWCKSHSLKAPEPRVLFPKAGEDKRPSSKREEISLAYLCRFVLLLGPLTDWTMPTHKEEGNLSIQSTESNANLSQKHPLRHTQK